MIQTDAGDHRDDWPADVRGIKAAAEPCLQDDDLHIGPGKVDKRHRRHDLKPGDPANTAMVSQPIERVDRRPDDPAGQSQIGR